MQPDVLSIIVALGVLVGAYCVLLWPEWTGNPDLSHALFAPIVFGLLIWEGRRHGTQRWLPAGRWPALILALALCAGLILFALAGIFAASLAWTHALVCVILAASLSSFLLAGLVMLADDRLRWVPLNWTTVTAVFLWLLVAPLPQGSYTRITLALQGWVTTNVLQSLQLLGIPARQHGNIIELASTSVGIAEACSGIRSLISCVFAGFFFAAWLVRRPLGRMVLIVAAPLLALSMNFVRSLTLTLLANSGTDISGFWHDATGFAILGVTAVVLATLALLLESKGSIIPAGVNAPAATRPSAWRFRCFWAAQAGVLALGFFYYAKSHQTSAQSTPAPDLTKILPSQPADWQVVSPNNLYQFSSILQTSNLLERTYLRSTSSNEVIQLTVYIAYWAPGQAAVSLVASHTPDACWPGSGWSARPIPDNRQGLELSGLSLAPAEHRIFVNDAGFPQHVWFWHVYDGHAINYQDPYSIPALFKLALRYGFRRPGEQYFVRLSSNRPWAEIKDQALVREILSSLAKIGL